MKITTGLTIPGIDQFATWLLDQPHDRVVGRRCEADICPLAQWLVEALGVRRVLIESTFVDIEVVDNEWLFSGETPADHAAFIEWIDAGQGSSTADVTAMDCWRILVVLGLAPDLECETPSALADVRRLPAGIAV